MKYALSLVSVVVVAFCFLGSPQAQDMMVPANMEEMNPVMNGTINAMTNAMTNAMESMDDMMNMDMNNEQ